LSIFCNYKVSTLIFDFQISKQKNKLSKTKNRSVNFARGFAANGFGLGEGGDFHHPEASGFMRRTKL
jgi:hypothetical protein